MMKKKLITAVCVALVYLANAQQIMPMDKTRQKYRLDSLSGEIYQLHRAQKNKTITPAQQAQLISNVNWRNNLEDRVFIYGFGSSDAVSLDNVSANGGFSFGARLHNWDRMFLSVGIGGKVVKKEKQDSVNITSIFFPDNASTVAYAHYEFSLTSLLRTINNTLPASSTALDELIFFAEGSLQSRNVEAKDSTVHNFGIYNFSLGAKYRWTYLPNPQNKFSFDVGVGFGYVEIAPQSEKSFRTLVNPEMNQKKNVPTIYRGLNVFASVQYNDLIVYARLYAPISLNGSVQYEHNIYFSTGIKITGTFFSF